MTDAAWVRRLSTDDCGEHLRDALAQGFLDRHDWLLIHDLSLMEGKLGALMGAFASESLHAVAVKANPVVAILRRLVERGAGLECASMEEVAISLRAGCSPDRIVFDSPAKTRRDLAEALELGVVLNADNFDELERIGALLEQPDRGALRARVGLRINPMVGEGAIAATSVGGRVSKFGVPLEEAQRAIVEAFERWPWLTGVHVHVGSQGCTVAQLIAAAERIEGLIATIEARRPGQIVDVDIGGGLPVAYDTTMTPPCVTAYADALRGACPTLMSGRYRIITEFGRAIHANCGVAASRVEYVKRYGGTAMAVVHFGADFLMRPVYNPRDWSHEFAAFDSKGRPKTGSPRAYAMAGPLCFGGDFVGRDVMLPELEPGDIICARDVGAYTLSMWSRHCSRSQPVVLGATSTGSLETLRPAETPRGVALDWEQPREGSV